MESFMRRLYWITGAAVFLLLSISFSTFDGLVHFGRGLSFIKSARQHTQSADAPRHFHQLYRHSAAATASTSAATYLKAKTTALNMYITPTTESTRIRKVKSRRLLNATEEIALGRHIRKYRKIVLIRNRLQSKLGREPTALETARLLRLDISQYLTLIELGKVARAELIDCNILLVFKIARKYDRPFHSVSFDELVQAGYQGLIKAAERYDPEKGFRFSTYAYWWVRKYTQDATTKNGRLINISVTQLLKIKKFNDVKNKFTQEHDREPNSKELKDLLGCSSRVLRSLQNGDPTVFSCDTPLSNSRQADQRGSSYTANDFLISNNVVHAPEEKSCALRDAIRSLPDTERLVVECRFWCAAGRKLTYEEIGEWIGLNKRQTATVMYKALSKLRETQCDLAPIVDDEVKHCSMRNSCSRSSTCSASIEDKVAAGNGMFPSVVHRNNFSSVTL